MKRDMDLVRAILLTLEEQGPATFEKESSILYRLSTKFPALVQNEIRLIDHFRLLEEGGFITSDHDDPYDELFIENSQLTWQGHELLADIRDEGMWKKIKELAGENSLAVLKHVAVELTKKTLTGA